MVEQEFPLNGKPLDRAGLKTGTYLSRIVGVVSVGEHTREYIKGQKKISDDIYLIFEVPGKYVTKKDGTPLTIEKDGAQNPEPRTVRKRCTDSVSPKSTLAKAISTLFDIPVSEVKGFNLSKLILVPCTIAVELETTDDGMEYNKIVGISPPIDGVEVGKAVTEPYTYSVKNHSDAAFADIPEWLQNEVKTSTQWAELTANTKPIDIDASAAVADVGGVRVDMSTGEVINSQQGVVTSTGRPGF